MTRQIFAAEISFEDAPHHVREIFKGTENNIRQIVTQLKPVFDEVYALSTDNRFTLYVVDEDMRPLKNFFHLEHHLKGYVQYYYNTEEAVTHLFATASGLLSPTKGDARIPEQIRRSYEWARACGCLGITLDHLLCKAVVVGKAVRTATGIDKFCSSVVDTGMELLHNRFQNLHEKTIFIVGTGLMAKLALESLTRDGIRNIVITGYHYDRALQLATQFKVRVIKLEKAAHLFLQSEVIIGASHQELTTDVPAPEKDKPPHFHTHPSCFILDFGNPKNFKTAFIDSRNADVYDMDDLLRIHSSPLDSFGGLERGWSMVIKQSKEFVEAMKQLNYSPVLRAYLTRLFTLQNSLKVKPNASRSLKDILLLKKPARPATAPDEDHKNTRIHINNYLPENAREVVKNVTDFRKFRFYISGN